MDYNEQEKREVLDTLIFERDMKEYGERTRMHTCLTTGIPLNYLECAAGIYSEEEQFNLRKVN